MWGPISGCMSAASVSEWILRFLQVVLTWPVSAFGIAMLVALRFGRPLSEWLRNLQAEYQDGKWKLSALGAVSPPSVLAQGATVAEKQPSEGSARVEATPKFPENSSAALFAKKLQDLAKQIQNPDDRENYLIGIATSWNIAARFEWLNAFILGSQIRFLEILAFKETMPIDMVRSFFEESLGSPGSYPREGFQAWLDWLHRTAELIEISDAGVTMKPDGREFLKYIAMRGYPLARSG